VRARNASATSVGRQWVCMSIMAMAFLLGFVGNLPRRRRGAN
jgi:hypothetical protein